MTVLYDCHNHLADERLLPNRAAIIAELERAGVKRVVVNGTSETDWRTVEQLAERHEFVLPSYGLHPWYVGKQSNDWQRVLTRYVAAGRPSAIGEIGLDRWIEGYHVAAQEEAFLFQLNLAAERNLPVSIHCLRAWGRLLDLLKSEPRPKCGFLLHSYGGSAEMIGPLAKLGAYFSISGYFAHERKARQREVFQQVPLDRLLIETDAPDMLPAASYAPFQLADPKSGNPINHPANIQAVYRFAAELRNMQVEDLATQVAQNFQRLFGRS